MTAEDVRAQIVEAMAEAIFMAITHYDSPYGDGSEFDQAVAEDSRRYAEAALDAALAVTVQEPCPECKGREVINIGCDDTYAKCPRCKGSGTVPGEPVLVPRWRMEQVGWAYRNRYSGWKLVDARSPSRLERAGEVIASGGFSLLTKKQEGDEPVYRIRDESARSIPSGDAK